MPNFTFVFIFNIKFFVLKFLLKFSFLFSYIKSNDKINYLYYKCITRFDFTDFNDIYECSFLRKIMKNIVITSKSIVIGLK